VRVPSVALWILCLLIKVRDFKLLPPISISHLLPFLNKMVSQFLWVWKDKWYFCYLFFLRMPRTTREEVIIGNRKVKTAVRGQGKHCIFFSSNTPKSTHTCDFFGILTFSLGKMLSLSVFTCVCCWGIEPWVSCMLIMGCTTGLTPPPPISFLKNSFWVKVLQFYFEISFAKNSVAINIFWRSPCFRTVKLPSYQ
jgi:hypothetical protein